MRANKSAVHSNIRISWVFFVGIVLLAFAFRVYGIDHASIGSDEPFSLMASALPMEQIRPSLRTGLLDVEVPGGINQSSFSIAMGLDREIGDAGNYIVQSVGNRLHSMAPWQDSKSRSEIKESVKYD
jgi:hypothetical protein